MALYVVKENQELLWNIINNNTFVQQYFAKVGPDKKPVWFRDIISRFYEENKGQKMSINDLHTANKSTISYMINDIREQESKNIPGFMDTDAYRFQSNGIYTPPIVPDNRKDMYASQFDQRQKEYQQMTDKKPPKEIDFRENIGKDTMLTNMDDLMKQQLLERERELDIYKPIDLTGSQTSTIKIDNSANIQIEVENVDDDVEDVEMTITNIKKKGVSWEDVQQENPFKEQIIEIEKKYTELSERIEKQQNNSTLQKLNERIENIEKKILENNIWKQKYEELNDKYDALQMHTNLLTKKMESLINKPETNQVVDNLVSNIEDRNRN